MEKAQEIISLLDRSHSVFHVVKNMKERLQKKGFKELKESEPFALEKGGKYFVERNGSSILAFAVPSKPKPGFRIVATHNDSPTFVLKPSPILNQAGVSKLSVEPYGGAIYYSWLDRPLSLAGRVYSKEGDKVVCTLVDIEEDLLVIPSLAIHQNREVNKGVELNAAIDMVPLWNEGAVEEDFKAYLSDKTKIPGEILSFDLSLYVRTKATFTGKEGSMVLSPRLDDLSSAYASLLAVEDFNKEEGLIPVFLSLDNEEVGSLTAQGACSDFLHRTLERILASLGYNEEEKGIALSRSFLLSVDNGHANHPNHPEKADASTKVGLNQGIVLKWNAEQRYTTSGRSASFIKALCLQKGLAFQEFTNRSDLRGGSTLGNLSNGQVSLLSADIGMPMLAMHSAVELCGKKDMEDMVVLLSSFYEDGSELPL